MTCDTFRTQARERVAIQSMTLTDDGYGGQSKTWTALASAWAVVTPLSGGEVFRAMQLESRVTHKFLIRYRSIFKAANTVSAYRIVFDDRYFSIKFIRNFDSDMKTHGRAFQEIMAEESQEEVS